MQVENYLVKRNQETCDGKIKYPTSKSAKSNNSRVYRGVAFIGRREPQRLHEYMCHKCGYWHLGHPVSTRDIRRKKGTLIPPHRKKFRL